MSRTFSLTPYLVSSMLILVGVIHLLPLTGALGSERLAALYGLRFDEPSLEVLMRHRAVLFGLLGTFFIFAAFKPTLQHLALVAGFVSVISFLFFALSAENFNSSIRRVVIADWIALAALTVAAAARFLPRTQAHA